MLTDPDKIHAELLRRNAAHLNQAAKTSFASGTLGRGLKWDGTGRLAEDILTGEVLQKTRYSSAMQLYLESLKMNDLSRMNIVKPVISYKEY